MKKKKMNKVSRWVAVAVAVAMMVVFNNVQSLRVHQQSRYL